MIEFVVGGLVGAVAGSALGSSHTVRTKTELVPYEKTVHEHRAPTDASIRLLREMEEKSRLQVAAMLIVDTDNIVSGCVVQSRDDFGALQKKVSVSFQLNGRTIQAYATLDEQELLNEDDARGLLVETIAIAVKDSLMQEIMVGFVRSELSNRKLDQAGVCR